MIFRQLFDAGSSSYTYLLADGPGGEALLIDPVLDRVERYLQLLRELDVTLVKALDTHLHADHISALGALRDRTRCITIMGEQTRADVVSVRVADGDHVRVGDLCLDVLYTPGHTDDSYSFLMEDRVFTGDTLLIRGTGRTDFQNGDSAAQYRSLFGRLLRLPPKTLVYPGHDYKGDTVSTIGEEIAHNPRLQVKSQAEYAAVMGGLGLSSPKAMDVAVPANMRIGLAQEEIARRGWAVSPEQLIGFFDSPGTVLVDLRDVEERQKHGTIPGAVPAPYSQLAGNLGAGGMLHELAAPAARLVFYCAFGERSAMAVEAAQGAGIACACHLTGGLHAWRGAQGPIAGGRQ